MKGITAYSKRVISIAVPVLACIMTAACAPGTETARQDPVTNVINTINGEPVIPRHANTIYIETFMNRTSQPDIHERLMTMLKKNIADDGRLAITPGREESDLLLRGIILQYQTSPLSFSEFGRPEKMRMQIVMNIMLKDMKRDRIILQDSAVQAFRTYSETIPPIETEFQSRERLIESLAKRLLSMITSGWYTDQMTPVEKGKK